MNANYSPHEVVETELHDCLAEKSRECDGLTAVVHSLPSALPGIIATNGHLSIV